MTYPGHETPIQNLEWNRFLPKVFLSCASEMVVKLWDKENTKPLFRFDLGSQVTSSYLHDYYMHCTLYRETAASFEI